MSQGTEPEPPFISQRDPGDLRAAQITIVGLGLIGGSLAMALRDNRICRAVCGVARRQETIAEALERGAIDFGTTVLEEGVAEADIVILATPVRTIIDLIPRVGSCAKPGCLLLDVGSTKVNIIEAMYKLPPHIQAIGGHPMCGKENGGLAMAEATLFQGANFIFTPLERTGEATLRTVSELARSVGARPIVMEASRHDYLVAAISHIPYILSTSLMAAVEEVAASDNKVWNLAASGFRDSSRLAASDVTMMVDILITNRNAIEEIGKLVEKHLCELISLVRQGDDKALQRKLSPLQERRRTYHQPGANRGDGR